MAAWFIFNGLNIFMDVLFVHLNLTPKINSYLSFAIVFVPFCTLAFSQQMFPEADGIVFGVLFSIVYFFAASVLIFRDKFVRKAIVCIVVFSAMVIPYFLESLLLPASMRENNSDSAIVASIHTFPLIIGILLCSLFTFASRRKSFNSLKNNISYKKLFAFSSFLLSQILFTLGYTFENFNDSFRESLNSPLLSTLLESKYFSIAFVFCSFVIACFADFYLVAIMINSSKSENLLKEIKMKEYEKKLIDENAKRMADKSEEIQSIYNEAKAVIESLNRQKESTCGTDSKENDSLLRQLNREFDAIQVVDIN